MAFTVYQQPSEFSPAYNDIVYVVGGSTNISEPNYKYVFKIYLNDETEPIIIKKFPHPTLSSAYLNVGRIVERAVTHNIDTTVTGFQRCDKSINYFRVDFYEEFDIDSVSTLSEILVTGNTKYIWNGEIDFLNYQNYNFHDYLFNYSNILNHDLIRNVKLNDNGYLYLMQYRLNLGYIDNIEVISYDSSGTTLNTVAIKNTFNDNDNYLDKYLRVDVCPKGLNDADLWIGEQPAIPSNTARYEVKINWDNTEEIITYKTLQFKVVEYCNTEVFRLHYLNNLGAFESFNFARASKHTETIKKEKYKGVVKGLIDAETFGYEKSDQSIKSNYTQITETYKVRSEWLSEDYQHLLEQLVSSPCVFWEHSEHGLVSIDVKNTSFDYDNKKQKKMLMLELDFDLSFNRYRQRY